MLPYDQDMFRSVAWPEVLAPCERRTATASAAGLRERVLALQRAAGNRAVARTIGPRLRLAREPKTPPKQGWVIHPEAMKLLVEKMRALYEAIPRRDRINLKSRGTVAIGMATVDGDVRLVYTVNNNRASQAFHAAAEKLDLHFWRYDSGVKGRGPIGAPNDSEQLMLGFSEDNGAPIHGMVVSREECADCATVITGYGGEELRVAYVPDTADLPNPRNPPSRATPPAKTAAGELDTGKTPPKPPPGKPPSGSPKVIVDDTALRGQATKGTTTTHVESDVHGTTELPPGSVFARKNPLWDPVEVEPPIIALPPQKAPAGPPTTAPPAKPTSGAGIEPPVRSTTPPTAPAGNTPDVGDVKPTTGSVKTGGTPEVDIKGAARAGRISGALSLFNLMVLLGRLLPDLVEAEAINKHLTNELRSPQWQARLNALQPTVVMGPKTVYYLISFQILYTAHQSPKPGAFSNSYTVKGVKVVGLDLTYFPLEANGELDYPDKPDWAHPIWGGGYAWDATRKCAISSPARSDMAAE